MFDKAQNYMFAVIERDILDDFLKSEYGLQYLKALVDQDNEHKMEQKSAVLLRVNRSTANGIVLQTERTSRS